MYQERVKSAQHHKEMQEILNDEEFQTYGEDYEKEEFEDDELDYIDTQGKNNTQDANMLRFQPNIATPEK